MSPGKLLSVPEVAEYLGVSVRTVYGFRYRSVGPKGYKVGGHVRYRLKDVESWLEEQADRPKIAAG